MSTFLQSSRRSTSQSIKGGKFGKARKDVKRHFQKKDFQDHQRHKVGTILGLNKGFKKRKKSLKSLEGKGSHPFCQKKNISSHHFHFLFSFHFLVKYRYVDAICDILCIGDEGRTSSASRLTCIVVKT